jgi:hypothetical protein
MTRWQSLNWFWLTLFAALFSTFSLISHGPINDGWAHSDNIQLAQQFEPAPKRYFEQLNSLHFTYLLAPVQGKTSFLSAQADNSVSWFYALVNPLAMVNQGVQQQQYVLYKVQQTLCHAIADIKTGLWQLRLHSDFADHPHLFLR